MSDDKALLFGKIVAGDFDEDLDIIVGLVDDRRKAIEKSTPKINIGVGDLVMFSNHISPKYLAGGKAEVVGMTRTDQFRVKILEVGKPPKNSRFRVGQTVVCSLSLLRLIDTEAEVAKIREKYSA